MVERDRFLSPYKNTDLLVSEIANLKINKQTANFKIELIDGGKEKDTFSALEYGLWYIYNIEKEYYAKRRKKRPSLANAMKMD